MAKNSHASARLLASLAKDSHISVLCAVAAHPNTPLHTLDDLSRLDEAVRCAVAENENAGGETLSRLATDKQWSVQRIVANNPSTPIPALRRLAKNDDEDIRQCVAWNPSTPADSLKLLSEDDCRSVSDAVAVNPSAVKIQSGRAIQAMGAVLDSLQSAIGKGDGASAVAHSAEIIKALAKLADRANDIARSAKEAKGRKV